MLTYPDGKLMLQKAVEGLAMPVVDRIIITVVKEHCDKYDADVWIRQAFGDDVEICMLDEFTASQSETVAATIKHMNVRGGFIAKDSDGYVNVSIDETDNFLVGADLRKHPEISNVAAKSFIILNEQGIIIDIVEKKVCSNIVNIGVYGFRSAEEFVEVYDSVKKSWASGKEEIYLSHIVSYMMGQKRYFAYKEAIDYEDWGLLGDWRRAVMRRRVFFVDIDGVVFKNKGRYGKVNWDTEDIPLENNIRTLRKLTDQGAQLVFCTARTEAHRAKVETSLKAVGLSWHSIVTECNHSQRVIINDFAGSNPYPSCKAVNIPRNNDHLDDFVDTIE